MTSSIVGSFSTFALLMPVSSTTTCGISLSGLINCENLSTIVPSTIFTAPISVILSFLEDSPVVSISKTT